MTTSIPVMVPIRIADLTAGPMRDIEARIGAAVRRMTGRPLSIRADHSGLDRMSAKMATVGTQMRTLGRDQMRLTGDQLAATRQRTMGLLAEGAALGATAYSFGKMLSPAIQFEASMAKVGAVSRATDEELATMTAAARQLGRDTTWSAIEAAEGMQYLSMAGFKVNETVAAMPGILDLASAGAIDLGSAADIASNILTGFGKEAGDMGTVGDVLVNTFTSSNASLSMLGETMKYVAPIAAAAAVDIEQVAAMTGKLGDAGIQGSQAGTALRAMISRLQAPPKAASDALAQLGVQTSDANGNLRDMFDIMRDLDRAMDGMGTAAKGEMTSAIFGMEAASAATVLLGEAGSGALQDYAESLKEVGSAARVAAEMNDTAQGALKTLGSRMGDLLIEVGNVFLPLLVELIDTIIPVIDQITNWVAASPGLIKAIGLIAAGLFGLKAGFLGVRLLLQPIIGAFWMFNGVLAAGSWTIGAVSTVLAVLVKAMSMVRFAAINMGRALLAIPIGLAVAAIAGAVYLIYRNWEAVGPWFRQLWDNIARIFGGFTQFLTGIFTGNMGLAVDGLKLSWSGLQGFFQTLWNGITGLFRWAWDTVIKPITDALGITEPIVAAWQTLQAGLDVVLSAISGAFSALWSVISPVIDGLKWVRDKGADALASVGIGGGGGSVMDHFDPDKAPGPSRPETPDQAAIRRNLLGPSAIERLGVPARAQGGSFGAGPLLVGERGPELRYENRAGFIAHNNALRRMADLSTRIRAGGVTQPAMPAAFADAFGGGSGAMPLPSATRSGPVSYAPHYNIEISGSGLSEGQLRAAIQAELRAAERRAQAELRRLMHD